MITVRRWRRSDASGLLKLFRDTVRRVNAADYTPEQIGAWASEAITPEEWEARFAGRFTLVAEAEGEPIGFAELEPGGRIDRLYVSADHQRRGIGHALLAALISEAEARGLPLLTVEASLTAKPFFEAHGFSVITRQEVVCRGVTMENYRMERPLG